MQHRSLSSSTACTIFGEVLWDVFPDGAVLGGAPFNVACHLQGLGVAPLFISAVGDDLFGRGVLQHMQTWGMRTEGIHVLNDKPTGQVTVAFDPSGDSTLHQFTILDDQAYDAISCAQVRALMQTNTGRLRYFGSLCLRHEEARKACACLLEAGDGPVFVDINLRAPWYQETSLRFALQSATILKLNVDELAVLANMFGDSSAILHSGQSIHAYDSVVRRLMQQFSIADVILTDGEHGAYWWNERETLSSPSIPASMQLIDTVGAGDAFSAVCIKGILEGWETAVCLQRAQTLAGHICQRRGAIPPSVDFYATFRQTW